MPRPLELPAAKNDKRGRPDWICGNHFAFTLKNIERFERETLLITEKVAAAKKPLISSPIEAPQSKIAELEAKIKALEAQIEQAKQSYPEAPQAQADVLKVGEAGRAANSEKALARWQAVIPAMLEVYHGIMSAEVEQYTRARIDPTPKNYTIERLVFLS